MSSEGLSPAEASYAMDSGRSGREGTAFGRGKNGPGIINCLPGLIVDAGRNYSRIYSSVFVWLTKGDLVLSSEEADLPP